MAIIKVKNTWTQVPNTWLKDKNLSLKAKGLLAVMQSLPDGWDFSVAGLTTILNEGLNAVRSAVHELEETGYLTRTQVRDAQGKITDTVWTLYETPHDVENPPVKNRSMGEAIQLNTNKEITKKERESADSADASSALSPFSFDVSKQEEVVSVDTQSADRKKLYALCTDLLGLMGQSGIKERQKLASAVRARLKIYSELELKEVARWSATQSDEFLKIPSRLFSEGGFEQALVLMSADKKKRVSREF